MKRLQPFISCYLALCLPFAGAVAFSPALHRLVEHGGQGVAHTHRGGKVRATAGGEWHHHGDGSSHHHPPMRSSARGLFAHSYAPAGQPVLSFSGLWETIRQLVKGAASDRDGDAPSSDDSDHQHHSLPQLLAAGLIEQHLDVPFLSGVPVAFLACDARPHTPFVARDWNPQTAGRAPPASQS